MGIQKLAIMLILNVCEKPEYQRLERTDFPSTLKCISLSQSQEHSLINNLKRLFGVSETATPVTSLVVLFTLEID